MQSPPAAPLHLAETGLCARVLLFKSPNEVSDVHEGQGTSVRIEKQNAVFLSGCSPSSLAPGACCIPTEHTRHAQRCLLPAPVSPVQQKWVCPHLANTHKIYFDVGYTILFALVYIVTSTAARV